MHNLARVLVGGVLLLAFCATAFAHTATVTWTLPTTRTDGSALPSSAIASVQVFDNGTQIGQCTGACTSFTTGTLLAGPHSFTVTVTDTSTPALVSAQSAAFALTVPAAAPAAATGLNAVLN